MKEDDLDAMLTGTSVPTTTTPAVATTPASTAAAPLTNPPTQSTAMEAEEDEDEDEDDDDGPVALVLDAPTGAGGRGGSFGTPINIKTQRYSRWGTPATPAQPTPSPHASATPVAASPATTSTTTTFAPLIPSSTSVAAANSSHTSAPSTTATSSSRPFRLPLPNDNIFESGQHLDQRVDRPWTLPGADISDWFNYGFDEETWKLYCQKQIQQRINASVNQEKQIESGENWAMKRMPSAAVYMQAPHPFAYANCHLISDLPLIAFFHSFSLFICCSVNFKAN